MLKLIIEKELRETIGSSRFAISFGICALLIILAFYVGARNYQVTRAQYEAALAENLRQMEGITDWMMVDQHIFLPPLPIAALVTGIANDIGRTVEVHGRGELTAEGSRFNEDPLFAVFRFLDLDFIFQIVLSLFAILFAYNAINGEKEQGTLRLTFANAVPRATYILGKMAGTFLALAVPLLIPLLIGCLLLILLGIPLNGDDWGRLALIIGAGLLYFGVFLTLSIWVSALTRRSASSFLLLLILWLFAVLIIPRSAVLLAGRAVDVLPIDEIATQKSRLMAQLWEEDRKVMANFRPSQTEDTEAMLNEFNQFMQDQAEKREQKLRALSERLEEQRRNGERLRERWALWLARLSPTASFSLAAMNLAGTSLMLKQQYLDAANAYQERYAAFIGEKTGGMLRSGGFVVRRIGGADNQPPPIDPREIPAFDYQPPPLPEAAATSLADIGLLACFNLLCFAGAFVGFLRYDVR